MSTSTNQETDVTPIEELREEAEFDRRNQLTLAFMEITQELAAAKSECAAQRLALEAKLAPYNAAVDEAFAKWLAAKTAWGEQVLRNQQALMPMANRVEALMKAISELNTSNLVIQWRPVEG